MTRRQHPEDDLHRTVADYLTLAMPPAVPWTTMPAGGGGRVRGAKLKAMGLQPGWPDLQVCFRGRYIGIELKSEKGRLTSAQKAMHARLRLAEGLVYTATSVEAVEGFLRGCGVPLKATTGARAA